MQSVVSLEEMKSHLNVVDDVDDALIESKIEAATAHVARAASVDFDELGELGEPIPEDLQEAVRMLVAHLYENREATVVGISASALPLGFDDLIRPHRKEWF